MSPSASQARYSGHGLTEGFVTINGEPAYGIPNVDRMLPFLMSIVSDSDLWMFASSTGGLTAGRSSPEHALFPYETDDRLHCLYGVTGPITLLRITSADGTTELWEPFAGVTTDPGITRNLYKSLLGHQVTFEEHHARLGLTFRYTWQNCRQYGFVRTASLENFSGEPRNGIELLDGLLNILPACTPMAVQQGSSCLLDAYKLSELDSDVPLAIYALNSQLTDRAEPSESLRATTVWTAGLPAPRRLLSGREVTAFRRGMKLTESRLLRGQRGSFLLADRLSLPAGQTVTWHTVCDTHQSQTQVSALRQQLRNPRELIASVQAAIATSAKNLNAIIASSDGIQSTARQNLTAHHQASTLFNAMRGGIFVDHGLISAADFGAFVRLRNRAVWQKHQALLGKLSGKLHRHELIGSLAAAADVDLLRLGDEYLPLTFGRRHGDPSRPWNMFAIRIANDDGSPALTYQGNWRDIFQNWESLCLSFPEYLPSIVAKFLNASTIDGFNPYRISREGIDWEVPEPHNPWSNIGYWGDHQLIYLLRLLEASSHAQPGQLQAMLNERRFAFADVPYRLRPAADLFKDPRKAIDFDDAAADKTHHRVKGIGSDGRLLASADGTIHHATLAEKLLIPVLSKLCCMVPGGGIWMNTQRPEWNDANNALAGYGLSVVTLCYLRRTLRFLADLFASSTTDSLQLSAEVAAWLAHTSECLKPAPRPLNDTERMAMLARLSQVFSDYRWKVYRNGLSGAVAVPKERVLALLNTALAWVDLSITANRRPDGMYHGYNVLKLSADGQSAGIRHLPEMLEGQVAVLSAGVLTSEQALGVIDAMFSGPLFVTSQGSFLLYPDREVPNFLAKNAVPAQSAASIELLRELLARGDSRVIVRESDTLVRFAPDLRNADDLLAALSKSTSDPKLTAMADRDSAAILDLYEATFNHHAFTGRSGSMFGYEGLGCIYWHMVAKLLLAVQELYFAACDRNEPAATLRRLAEAYYRVRSGFGFNKTAAHYGAFPTDPYSHTPSHSGARQPGMTGQVKEEMLTRWGELGILLRDGVLSFQPRLLEVDEFHASATTFEYVDMDDQTQSLPLPAGSLAFTVCQVPVVYRLADGPARIRVRQQGGTTQIEGNSLDPKTTSALLYRSGQVQSIEVDLPRAHLLA
jgi:hypothetical protein